MSVKNLNYLLFLFVSIAWGGSFLAIKYAVAVWPPVFSAAFRVALSLVFILLYFKYLKKDLRVPFDLRWRVWLAGLFAFGIPFSFLFWGERFISPGLAGIINCTMPIWTFILSLIFFGKETKATPFKIMGLLFGFAGILIIFYPMVHMTNTHNEIMGALAVLVMVISYAIGSILNQHLFSREKKVDFYANIYHQHWSALIYLVVASLLLEKWPNFHVLFEFKPLMATLYLSLFSTAMGWFCFYHLIREWGAVRTSTIAYVLPIVAIIGDIFLFNIIPGWNELLGILIIIPSVILIQFL